MKTSNVILAGLAIGGAYLLYRAYQQQQLGQPIMGGLLNGPDTWGAAPGIAPAYAPEYYAGGRPSTAGSAGSGNLNPLTSIVSSLSTILRGAFAGPNASAPIAGYGKPAAPATAGGPTSAVPAGTSLSLPLNRATLQDPGEWYGDPAWLLPSSNIDGDFIWNAAPPDISANAQGDYEGLGLFY